MKDLAQVLRMSTSGIYGAVSLGTFPIPTFKVGRHRLAKTEDVAAFFNEVDTTTEVAHG